MKIYERNGFKTSAEKPGNQLSILSSVQSILIQPVLNHQNLLED